MADYTLNIPEEVYIRAQQIAAETSQPVDQLMIEYLRTLSTPLPTLPPDEAAELEALRHLSDDALWTIAREQMPQDVQEQMQILMDKNNLGTITDEEYKALEEYVERGNRLMVRKAEAAGILTDRGHKFTQKDFSLKDE
jgi:hypothetical protein